MDINRQTLSSLGFASAEWIGSGAEADVYAVSERTVLRLMKPGSCPAELEHRVTLLAEIRSASSNLSFQTPCVETVISTDDRCGTLERRLPGEPLSRALERCQHASRETLLRAWLDVSTQISDIRLRRDWFGELAGTGLSEYSSFQEYWSDRLDRSLRSRGPLLDDIDVQLIATAMPEPDEARLVHLDLFADNLLWDGDSITAVLDFGFCSIMGDARLSSLFAAVYVLAFPMGEANDDGAIVRTWLGENALLEFRETSELMAAAYWSFANDDLELDVWCRSTLDRLRLRCQGRPQRARSGRVQTGPAPTGKA